MGYSDVHYLVSNFGECSRVLSVIDFQLSSILIQEHILYNLNTFKFIEISFMDQIMVCL